jgi:hypothetical protein
MNCSNIKIGDCPRFYRLFDPNKYQIAHPALQILPRFRCDRASGGRVIFQFLNLSLNWTTISFIDTSARPLTSFGKNKDNRAVEKAPFILYNDHHTLTKG